MEPRKPVLFEAEAVHPCYCVDVTERVKDSRLKYISCTGRDKESVSNLYELHSPQIGRFVSLLKKHPLVRKVDVLQKGKDFAEINVKSDYDAMILKWMNRTQVVFIEPTLTEEGVDKMTLLAPSEKNMRELMRYLEEKYDVKLKAKRFVGEKERLSFDIFRSAGFLRLKSVSELLTDKQMECFNLACRYGYYEEPKRIEIGELARMSGVSVPTFSEHLRKAEMKLLPIFAEIMRLVR